MKYALALLLPSTLVRAQGDCPCTDQFAWAKETFETNDAGFAYALEQKGRQGYELTTQRISAAVDTTTDAAACRGLIYEWLGWFRSGHFSVRQVDNGQYENATAQSIPTPEEIRATYRDWETVSLSTSDFDNYLTTDQVDPFEGKWRTGDYHLGVRRMGDEYVGFILQADSVYWMPGQVKLRFRAGEGGTYYMQNHSATPLDRAVLMGNNYLDLGFARLERETLAPETDELIGLYLRTEAARKPFVEQVGPTTLYLRIPSFDQNEKASIDSTIAAHREEILSTENLILDIHSGTGGSDWSYAELLPILYTNPIRTTNTEFYSTPLNNQRMLDFVADSTAYGLDEKTKAWALRGYDTLTQHPGEFVNIDSGRQQVETFDTAYPYPARIAILIDGGNGSTDEEFLLAARQSQKVKLFGRSTFGVLDISNMNFVEAPCGDFKLGYSITRSLRIPDYTIDGHGVQPDYFIDRTVGQWAWIGYVLETWGVTPEN